MTGVVSMQTTRFFPGFLLHEHLHDALVKLEKWCEEGLDGQHPNIWHRSGRDSNSLHRQGIIALRIVTAREHEEATSHSLE